jgi:hypothetical protein
MTTSYLPGSCAAVQKPTININNNKTDLPTTLIPDQSYIPRQGRRIVKSPGIDVFLARIFFGVNFGVHDETETYQTFQETCSKGEGVGM